MKRFVMMIAIVSLGLASFGADAAVNSVTPSTNAINEANGWAYVVVTATGPGTTDLQFISTRSFYSCFEYRTDGDTSQAISATNYNTLVTDGLYPYTCVNNSTKTVTIHANAYVEVRMVFGAESDERFDWTLFEVPKCAPTGFVRDGIDLTAAMIDPEDPVIGQIDATTCNIGVYYGPGKTGQIAGAEIFGANYYGVVVNAASVDVSDTSIHDIGESPLNGSQHGVGVLYTTIDQAGDSTGESATGTLSGATITNYQKNGVVVSGEGAAVEVRNNTVTGQGMVDYIAQNGIQISYGATALVTGNTVSGNWYTPATWTACGLLFYDAGGVKQDNNRLSDNQTNLCNAGRGGGKFND